MSTAPLSLEDLAAQLARLEPLVKSMSETVDKHNALLDAAEGSPLLSRKTGDHLYSPAVMRRQLASGGVAPLPLDGLQGAAAHTQAANIPILRELPQLGDPAYKSGDAVVVNDTFYHRTPNAWNAMTSPASAAPVIAQLAAAAAQQTIMGGGGSSGGGGGGIVAPGVVFDTSATLAGLPAGLAASDAGRQYYNTYFGRMWIWTGTVWKYADAGMGAGGQCSTSSSAVPPEGGLWQICDGSVVACALDNATIGNKTATHAEASGGNNPMIEGGTGSTGAAQAAAAATFVGGSTTGADSDAGVTFLAAGVGSTAALKPHTHPIPALNVPSEANGGLSLRVSMAWWMRQ